MTAKIRDSVIMPNQTPVRVSINATPVPSPKNAGKRVSLGRCDRFHIARPRFTRNSDAR